jgi:chemotaxis protein MotB
MVKPIQPQIIIIKRVKKGHAAHHGGAWKVAYADFVTAMMALFMVLWLVSSSEQVKKAIGGYFNDPTGKGKEIGNGMRGAGGESLSLQKDDMNKLKDRLAQAIKSAQPFQEMKEHVTMTVTGQGLRVELLEDAKGMFFESGSAEPTPYGKELMALLAAEIGKLPNQVTIEGHTDSKPFSGRKDYSNWELSADRANSARRWMQENGLRADQVTQVRGFADQNLRKPDDPTNDSNRRVSFFIQYQTTASQVVSGATGASGAGGGSGRAKSAAVGSSGAASASGATRTAQAIKLSPAPAPAASVKKK